MQRARRAASRAFEARQQAEGALGIEAVRRRREGVEHPRADGAYERATLAIRLSFTDRLHEHRAVEDHREDDRRRCPRRTRCSANIFAFCDASCAPAMSPCASFEFTCAAKMIDTMPRGRQQQSVTTIDCHEVVRDRAAPGTPTATRRSSTAVAAACTAARARRESERPQFTQTAALSRLDVPQFGQFTIPPYFDPATLKAMNAAYAIDDQGTGSEGDPGPHLRVLRRGLGAGDVPGGELRVYLRSINDRDHAEGKTTAERRQHGRHEVVVDLRPRRKATDALAAVRADGGVVGARRLRNSCSTSIELCDSFRDTARTCRSTNTMSQSKFVVVVSAAYSCSDSCSNILSAPALAIA